MCNSVGCQEIWCDPLSPAKGHLISKCLFGVFKYFQKMNENKSTWGIISSYVEFFVRFLRIPKSSFEIIWPLPLFSADYILIYLLPWLCNYLSSCLVKPLQNKKGQKNLRYPRKKQSFSNEKDCLFVGYLKHGFINKLVKIWEIWIFFLSFPTRKIVSIFSKSRQNKRKFTMLKSDYL